MFLLQTLLQDYSYATLCCTPILAFLAFVIIVSFLKSRARKKNRKFSEGRKDRLRAREVKINQLVQKSEFNLIKQFSQKYKDSILENESSGLSMKHATEFSELHSILCKKGGEWNLDKTFLLDLVIWESENHNSAKLTKYLHKTLPNFNNKCFSLEVYIKALKPYLGYNYTTGNYYNKPERARTLDTLLKILRQNSQFDGDINSLENEVKEIESKIADEVTKKEEIREEQETNEQNFEGEPISSLITKLNLKREILKIPILKNSIKEEAKREISELETRILEMQGTKIDEFLGSSEYSFVQKAVIELKNGNDINYSELKDQIGDNWIILTELLPSLVSKELEKQGLSYSFLQNQINKRNNFYSSSSYKYIKQFTKKYGDKGKTEDFNQLQTLLKNWQFDFSIEELKSLVSKENKKQQVEKLKSKILTDNPHNRGAILKSYLNFYRSNDDINLKTLAELLEERYSSSEYTVELKSELEVIEKRIELENFEKRLLQEDEQIQLNDIDKLNGYEFEDFLKNLFSKMGYQVEQTKLSGDQGADLVVVKFGEKTVIQAKRYGAKVGNYAVQEIMAAISLYKAQRGMVITNNYFTPAAVELANANNIELIDRDALEELINKHW